MNEKNSDVKIAIHYKFGNYSDRWIKYCQQNKMDFEILNFLVTDIIDQLAGFNDMLFHYIFHKIHNKV